MPEGDARRIEPGQPVVFNEPEDYAVGPHIAMLVSRSGLCGIVLRERWSEESALCAVDFADLGVLTVSKTCLALP